MGNTARGGGTAISGNVFANSPTVAGFAINLEYGSGVTNPTAAVGINDLTIDGNVVYNWTRASTSSAASCRAARRRSR